MPSYKARQTTYIVSHQPLPQFTCGRAVRGIQRRYVLYNAPNWQHTSSTGSCLSTALKGVSFDFAMLACDSLLCCSFPAYHWNKSIEPAFSFTKNWAKEIPDYTEQTVQGMAKATSTTTLRQVRTIKTISKKRQRRHHFFFLATMLALEKIPRGRSRPAQKLVWGGRWCETIYVVCMA